MNKLKVLGSLLVFFGLMGVFLTTGVPNTNAQNVCAQTAQCCVNYTGVNCKDTRTGGPCEDPYSSTCKCSGIVCNSSIEEYPDARCNYTGKDCTPSCSGAVLLRGCVSPTNPDPEAPATPIPTNPPGSSNPGQPVCSTGNRCYEGITCCDDPANTPGCDTSWSQGYYNTCGGGGGKKETACGIPGCGMSSIPKNKTVYLDPGSTVDFAIHHDICDTDTASKNYVPTNSDLLTVNEVWRDSKSVTGTYQGGCINKRGEAKDCKRVDYDFDGGFTVSYNPGGSDPLPVPGGDGYITLPIKFSNQKTKRGTICGTGSRPWGHNDCKRCDLTVNVKLSAGVSGPWWQAVDSDVTGGSIVSNAPSGQVVLDSGVGGYPGVAAYGGSLDTGDGEISDTLWSANSTSAVSPFTYSFFSSHIPSEATVNAVGGSVGAGYFAGGVESMDGYTWHRSVGDLRVDGAQNIGGRKVVLFVDGNLNINSTVNLTTEGSDFFMAVVSGNITVDGAVQNGDGFGLEGIYFAGGQFDSGVGNQPLNIRGAVASSGFALQRDLEAGNTTTPAEKIEYAPDLIYLYPLSLKQRQVVWREVAP